MTDKLEALSQPVGHFIEWQDAETGEKEWCECSKQNGVALYSQEYVTALLAALEEKDKEIKLLNAHLDVRGKFADQRIAELEQRLQQPIKLPDVTTKRHNWTTSQWIEHLGGRYQHGNPGDYIEFGSVMAVEEMLKQFKRTVIAITLIEIKAKLHEQGFKVEGE